VELDAVVRSAAGELRLDAGNSRAGYAVEIH
jgi:hypothetical protein